MIETYSNVNARMVRMVHTMHDDDACMDMYVCMHICMYVLTYYHFITIKQFVIKFTRAISILSSIRTDFKPNTFVYFYRI